MLPTSLSNVLIRLEEKLIRWQQDLKHVSQVLHHQPHFCILDVCHVRAFLCSCECGEYRGEYRSMQRSEEDIGVLLYHSSSYCPEQGLSLNLETGWWPVSCRDPPVSEPYPDPGPRSWSYRLSHTQLFTWVASI